MGFANSRPKVEKTWETYMETDRELTRREFLKSAAAAGAVAGLGLSGCRRGRQAAVRGSESRFAQAPAGGPEAVPTEKSRVVIVRDDRATGERAYQQPLLEEMLARGITALMGTDSEEEAWKALFSPDDVVGLKVNCLFGPNASTHPEVASAIGAGILKAGVARSNVVIWDRSDKDLAKTGYKINRGEGIRCHGTGWEEQRTTNGSFNGHLATILTQQITALVNVPILKDHSIAGVSLALKNHYGSFDNPSEYHGNHCDPYIADLNALPAIRNKQKLIVCDAIRGMADGGPGLSPENLWEEKALILSRDPVAHDYVGWQIIEKRRKVIGKPSLEAAGRKPQWIFSAAERGVGVAKPANIEVIEV